MSIYLIIGIVVLALLSFGIIIAFCYSAKFGTGLTIATAALSFLYFLLIGMDNPLQQTRYSFKPAAIYKLPDRIIVKIDSKRDYVFNTMEDQRLIDSTCTFYLTEYWDMYNNKCKKFKIDYTSTKR